MELHLPSTIYAAKEAYDQGLSSPTELRHTMNNPQDYVLIIGIHIAEYFLH